MLFVLSASFFTVIGMQIIGQMHDPRTLLYVVGWLMLILMPLAALDAWAAGILMGQGIAPWIRLVSISGVGVAIGLFILLNL